MPKLLERLPLQFRVLYRQFLLRVIDLEALSVHADIPKLLGQFAGVLIMLSIIHAAIAYAALLKAPWYLEQYLIDTMMLVAGLITIISWDSTFPDRRDVMVLSPLPLAPHTILFAKVAASATLLGIAALTLNIASGAICPLLLGAQHGSAWGFCQSFAAYWFTIIASSAFLYGSVLTVQGFTALLLSRRMFLRLSAILQLAAFAVFIGVYFLQPSITTHAAMVLPENQRLLACSPSFWFFALFNQLNGSLPSDLVWLARRAWVGLGVVGFGATASLLLCYLRTMRRTVEEPDLVPGIRSLHWAPSFGSPLETAIMLFSVRSLTRSRQHRVFFSFYLGLVAAVALSWLRNELSTAGLRPLNTDFLISSFMIMSFAVFGLRSIFSLPISLTANWIWRITQLCPSGKYIAAVRRVLILFAVVPACVVAVLLSFSFRPLHQVIAHIAVLALFGWIFTELSLAKFYKVPFTCSYLPGKVNVQALFWGFLLLLLLFAITTADFELHSLNDPFRYGCMTGVISALAFGMWIFNRHRAKTAVLYFEELPPEVITTLGLIFVGQSTNTSDTDASQHLSTSTGSERLNPSCGIDDSRRLLPAARLRKVRARRRVRCTEMMQVGEDMVEEIAKKRGPAGLVRFIVNIATRLPIEYVSDIRGDMRYALRSLIKSPGFALVGIVSMGLGIGLTTNVYSSEWALLSRGLAAAANAKHLVMPQNPVSYYYVEQYRNQKNLFAGVAAFKNDVPFNFTLQGDTNAKPERIFGQLVSPDYFSVLGVEAQRGRVFDDEVDRPGNAPVVVISDRFWRNHLHSSPYVVGQTVRLNGQIATIVGITPRNFGGAATTNPAEVFVPTTVPASLAPELANDVLHQRNAREFMAIMCLAPGVTIDSAEAALDGITRRLDEQDPSAPARADKARRVTLLPAGTRIPIPRNLRPMLDGFFVVLMGLIMAIACMNLATMLLARGTHRRKELAIRLGVGASRFRLIRQMISEGILLALLGGIAGFVLAYCLSVLNSQLGPISEGPIQADFSPDWRAAVFAFVIAILCGIGFSLMPALQATRSDVIVAKEGSALQLPNYRRLGLRNLVMVAQVAGSLTLLLITGFLVIGVRNVTRIETKFDPKTMVLMSIDPVRDGYTPGKAQALFEELPERLKTSGTVQIALAEQRPFSSIGGTVQLTAEDSRAEKSVSKEIVGAGYFAALSEPMLVGREFGEAGQRSYIGGSKTFVLPVVLNQSAARGFFGNKNALGERLRDGKQSYKVIGVISDLRNGIGIRQSVVYLPLTRSDFMRPPTDGITIMVRSNEGTDTLSKIRREIVSIDPNLTIFNAETLSDYLNLSRYPMRFVVRTYGGIGLFGLILSAIGLAGVTAYAVAQRRKEIGIRMALGASKGQVLRLVLREGMALVSVGTVLGFLGAVAIVKILSAMTNILVDAFRVGTNDPRLLIGAPLVLAALAMCACYVPARRAAKIDPQKALRQE